MTDSPASLSAERLKAIQKILEIRRSDVVTVPVDLLADLLADASARAQERSWRCFQCDVVLTDELSARIHFGADGPACMRSEPVLLGHLERTKHNLEVSQGEVKRLTEELANLDTTAREMLDEARGQLAALTQERDDLKAEIAEAREACPSVRLQDNFDAPLLKLVYLEVSRGFNRDSEVAKLSAELTTLRAALAQVQQERDTERRLRMEDGFAHINEQVAAHREPQPDEARQEKGI